MLTSYARSYLYVVLSCIAFVCTITCMGLAFELIDNHSWHYVAAFAPMVVCFVLACAFAFKAEQHEPDPLPVSPVYLERPSMLEFTATVSLPLGGTHCVTVMARNALHAADRLVCMGYLNPRNITQL